jgi:death-on-curing protein
VTFYLTVEESVEIVRAEGYLIVDAGLFASALLRPQMSVFGEDAYPDVWSKAAALMESLARNHTLADGNKRTAATLALLFLSLNGHLIVPGQEVEDFVVEVAQGHVTLSGSAEWLRNHSMPN